MLAEWSFNDNDHPPEKIKTQLSYRTDYVHVRQHASNGIPW